MIETVLNHETNEGNGPAPFRETPVRQGIDRPFWRIAAAIVILVAGAGGGYLTSAHQQRQGDEAARIALDDARTSVQAALFDALENVRSGEAVHWKSRGGQSSGRIIPVRTYRKEDAGYCREYQRASEGSGGSVIVHGVACRGNDGRWFPRFELVQDAHIDEATTW